METTTLIIIVLGVCFAINVWGLAFLSNETMDKLFGYSGDKPDLTSRQKYAVMLNIVGGIVPLVGVLIFLAWKLTSLI